jgi:hypothetical protein
LALWAGCLLALSIAFIVVGSALGWRRASLADVTPWVVGALLGAVLAIGYLACGALLARLHKSEDAERRRQSSKL